MPKSDQPGAGDVGAPDGTGVAMSTTMMLIAAGRSAQRRFEAALAEQQVTLRHIGAIGHLARNPELSYSDLARRARVTPQSMHATIGQLVDLGAVVTETRGRAAYPRLTDRGHDLLSFAAEAAAACDAEFGIDESVVPRLREELKKIAMQDFPGSG
ncbi:winged helix-turn-helix transcriptional regulator [Mycolicibacterium sp. S2-37]|uniref:MarR family winged helix-turn-helix transcriptional regulator n=1 Tax=Mycolicibacterium sp. S2-37 TaxID=2810297 RepID=UPI001A94385C|nr:MarR family winged helix-turn-helix transcriptional regulator [Mycolicibacterium sp. S2-37]MBO0678461.1 winged helix-turn-helix transcriptional regulator [Mycolicibacterium sp. S2-37]